MKNRFDFPIVRLFKHAAEHYPRQLHEMDRTTYVAMRRSEYERQQALIE